MKKSTKKETKKESFTKKLNKKAVALCAIVIIIIILMIVAFKIGENDNTDYIISGNISNLGLVTENRDAVYYNKYENGIVKVKNNKEYQITNETAYSMQSVGDYIYYLTKGENNSLLIKKVKTNGDDKKTIREIQTSISKFYILDNYLYYASTGAQSGIAKIALDTNSETLICEDKIEDFAVTQNGIYYTDDFGYLRSMNLGGTEQKVLLNDEITEFQTYGDWIYYYNQSENCLNKIKIDGSEKDKVSDKVNSYIFNVYKDKIYFYDSENSNISCISTNGKNLKVITEIKTNKTKINLTTNGELYYLNASNGDNNIYQMYRISTNGAKLNEIKY